MFKGSGPEKATFAAIGSGLNTCTFPPGGFHFALFFQHSISSFCARHCLPGFFFLIFHVEPGINIVSTPFSENQQIAFVSPWRLQAPEQPSPSARRGAMGLLRRAATTDLPGGGRFTASQIPLTALSFSNSAVNMHTAITACTQKRLLLIDCTACCYSAMNVLLIFCFHQIFHLKYERGSEAVSCIAEEMQSCCFASGSVGKGTQSCWDHCWVLRGPDHVPFKMSSPAAGVTQSLILGCSTTRNRSWGCKS